MKPKSTSQTIPQPDLEMRRRIPVQPMYPVERIPIPQPLYLGVSGLYKWSTLKRPNRLPLSPDIPPIPIPVPDPRVPEPRPPIPGPGPDPVPLHHADRYSTVPSRFVPMWFSREELRLDVDGLYPQMVASGTIFRGLAMRVHWIAELTKTGTNAWTGAIWYKDGDTAALPYTTVDITAKGSWVPSKRTATVTFSGGGLSPRTRTYGFDSPYYHPVEFEYDTVAGATAVTAIGTHDHPNRPAGLAEETLSLETVFRRAGFDVARSGDTEVPLVGAGANERWSDAEMHDAMQVHWSQFANRPQWALWVLFASLHDVGHTRGGVMFDDIGPNHRQGTAIFSDSFISDAPAGETHPDAWVARMRFWTAAHEMGHAFNLAHSWDKVHPSDWGTSWLPLVDDTEARSFMNYPYNVSGGQSAFFSDFDYRFIDEELLFMRHAPSRFVQMGNADWFDNHAFDQADLSPEPTFRLEARVNRSLPVFEFLEPVCLELKLTNVSGDVQLVDKAILEESHDLTLIIKPEGKPARRWLPYATACDRKEQAVLDPQQSLYASFFISAGLNGWDLAEPGRYRIQAALRHNGEDLVSAPLQLRIRPPRNYEEEDLAQEFFSEAVGRTLAFDGTQALAGANTVLMEAVDRLPGHRVALHAQVALGMPGLRNFKTLEYGTDNAPTVRGRGVKAEEAVKVLSKPLAGENNPAAETLGHIDYKYYVEHYSRFLSDQGDKKAAAQAQGALHKTLSARGVLKQVLSEIKATEKKYKQ